MASSSKLFQPIKIGPIELKHRVVLAPLTRFRASDTHVNGPLATLYYSQRASTPGTLMITEATFIAAKAGGFANIPGIWSPEQIDAWKKMHIYLIRVTEAVHAKGSFIVLQLWAIGRAAEPAQLIKEGLSLNDFVSASAIGLTSAKDAPTPRALSVADIKEYTELYATAAKNAIEGAGFDLVEIHGANGYLPEQFIHDSSNKRTDAYGGSIPNRNRFALEVIEAVAKAVGPEKTAIRFSPFSTIQDGGASDVEGQYTDLLASIQHEFPKLANVHIVEPRINGSTNVSVPLGVSSDFIRGVWKGPLISAGGYTPEDAITSADRTGDLIAFGRSFISNPDLPERILKGLPLAKGNRATYYAPGDFTPAGYTDYPFAAETATSVEAEQPMGRL